MLTERMHAAGLPTSIQCVYTKSHRYSVGSVDPWHGIPQNGVFRDATHTFVSQGMTWREAVAFVAGLTIAQYHVA